MSFLNQIRKDQPKQAGEKKGFDVVGVVLELKKAVVDDGKFSLVGVVKNNNRQVKEGQEVFVEFRDKQMESCMTNFTKGNGGKKALDNPEKAAGSLLCLEGCYLTDDTNGDLPVMNARWLTTVSSTMKMHDDRSVISDVFATPPVIQFSNPNPKPGEPDRIKLPVNADGPMYQSVKNDDGYSVGKQFPLEWMLEKLNIAPDPVVTMETFSSESQQINSVEHFASVLEGALSTGSTSMAMVRVTDGEQVMTRKVYATFKQENGEYYPDIEKTMENLNKGELFKGIDNEQLFAGLSEGKLHIEVVPGYRFRFSGNASQDDNVSYKIVQNVLDRKTHGYQSMFGVEPNNMAKVILPGLLREPTGGREQGYQDFSPTNFVIEESGTFKPDTFPTPMLEGRYEATPPLPVMDEEEPEPPVQEPTPEPEPAAPRP